MKNNFKSMNLFHPVMGRRFQDENWNNLVPEIDDNGWIAKIPENAKYKIECTPTTIEERHYELFTKEGVKECDHPMRDRTVKYQEIGNYSEDGELISTNMREKHMCRKCNGSYIYNPSTGISSEWSLECSERYTFSSNTHLGRESQKCVAAMVLSGDFTLEEAMYVLGNCCERCMNVLIYHYLGGEYIDDGYPEYSGEWHICGTECRFCEDVDHPTITKEDREKYWQEHHDWFNEKYKETFQTQVLGEPVNGGDKDVSDK